VNSLHPGVRLHPTAIVEDGVEIGPGTSVWDAVHLRRGARIGRDCIIGEKTYIAGDTVIGDRVKINAFVYICAGVSIDNGVMVAAGTIFTNDLYPRATTPDMSALRGSEPDENTLPTRVCVGATIGAGARIGCNLTIGRFAMVGMGSVVTRSIPDFQLVLGNPARAVAFVCRCGQPLCRIEDAPPVPRPVNCTGCGETHAVSAASVAASQDETGAVTKAALKSAFAGAAP
jgi:UDP-2-acetamido-3-amino-2,3-dideoxy-glucuronate N-acetyltransferase